MKKKWVKRHLAAVEYTAASVLFQLWAERVVTIRDPRSEELEDKLILLEGAIGKQAPPNRIGSKKHAEEWTAVPYEVVRKEFFSIREQANTLGKLFRKEFRRGFSSKLTDSETESIEDFFEDKHFRYEQDGGKSRPALLKSNSHGWLAKLAHELTHPTDDRDLPAKLLTANLFGVHFKTVNRQFGKQVERASGGSAFAASAFVIAARALRGRAKSEDLPVQDVRLLQSLIREVILSRYHILAAYHLARFASLHDDCIPAERTSSSLGLYIEKLRLKFTEPSSVRKKAGPKRPNQHKIGPKGPLF